VNEPDYLKRASDVMRERNATLAHTTVLESGEPLLQAKAEWALQRILFERFAEEGKRAYCLWVPPRNNQTPVGDQATHGCSRINYRVKLSAYNIALAGVAALAPGCTVVILLDAGPTDGEVNLIRGEMLRSAAGFVDRPGGVGVAWSGERGGAARSSVHACCLGCLLQFEMKEPDMHWQHFESKLLHLVGL
jgi:hypothetical protein